MDRPAAEAIARLDVPPVFVLLTPAPAVLPTAAALTTPNEDDPGTSVRAESWTVLSSTFVVM
jgi:hypothetical protein